MWHFDRRTRRLDLNGDADGEHAGGVSAAFVEHALESAGRASVERDLPDVRRVSARRFRG